MILQRYTFGSKSQLSAVRIIQHIAAYDIAKIYIWKQITTTINITTFVLWLLMILQRYTFGSKSQLSWRTYTFPFAAYDIAKIYIWKQITTPAHKV